MGNIAKDKLSKEGSASGRKKTEVKLNIPSPEEMLDSGVHLGHQARRWNPSMAPFIYLKKDDIHVIDLFKTYELLESACEFLFNVAASGGRIIFVGTKRQVSGIIKSEAGRSGGMYVNDRWLGGTLTNFKQIKKSIDMLSDLKNKLSGGEFDHYTKKERLEVSRKISKLEKSVGGISNLNEMPEALFVVDVKREKTAVREAKRVGMPVVALTDTNSDPTGIKYIIPGNDDSVKSLVLIIRTIADAVEKGYGAFGKTQRPKTTDQKLEDKGKGGLGGRPPSPKDVVSDRIEDSKLSNRAKNALIKAGYETADEVKKLSLEELEGIKGLGKKSVEEILDIK